MASVKAEVRPEIKLEPPVSTPSNVGEADEFEDDTDLVIPPSGGQAWLVKVPAHLWKAWAEIYRDVADDQPVEIGKMRVWKDEAGDQDATKQRVQIRLNAHVPQHADLPKNYDLRITTRDYSNVVVFSEKDLPGHKNQPFGRRSVLSAPRNNRINKGDRYPRAKPGAYHTVIPKQTALAPQIQHVADAYPIVDDSYYQHFEKTYQASLQPKKTTTFQTGIDRRRQPGTTNLSGFSSFGITSRPGAVKNKKKAPKEKAVRISEQSLLDAIYQCFRRYKYWSLKALKTELKQPEQYIKQTLDNIATLVRSGDFSMTYVLNPEYASIANIKADEVKEETAAVKSEIESEGVTDDEMDDDEGDFEDVKMDDAGA